MSETRKLFSNSLVVIAGTLIASIFSYLFNMLMGRLLGPEKYGEMTALLSLLTIVTVAGGAVLTVVMKYTSELFSARNFAAIKRLLTVFSRYTFYVSLVIFGLLLIMSRPIANYLSISNLFPVIIAFSSVIFGLLITVNRGVLQGIQKFVPLTVVNILEMALRLAIGIILVKLGFALSGAIGAIVLASAIAYFVALFIILPIVNKKKSRTVASKYQFDRKEILSYSMPAFATAVLLAVGLNMDIILVKHYFSPESAGVYAAVSTIAKIITYITSPIISVMFPMISEKYTLGDKHWRIFFFSIALVLVGGLAVLGLYVIAPAKIISLLYGQTYVSFYYLLPEIGLAILFYSLVNLLVNYYLVIKDFRFIWFFVLAMAGLVTSVIFYHPSIIAIVRLFVSWFSLLFLSIVIYYLASKRDQIKKFLRGEEF